MAISTHPLSNVALGAFDKSYTRKQNKGGLITVFLYENGFVVLNKDWKWETTMDSEPNEERHKTAPFTFSPEALDKLAEDIIKSGNATQMIG